MISATATDAADNTSEFSQLVSVLPAPGTAALVGGTLFVSGKASSDTIVIEPRPGQSSQVRVKVNGKIVSTVSKAGVQKIVAHGLGGNDTIVVNASLNIPAELHGNSGHDRLFGAKAADWLLGESGNDSLYGLGGNDHLEGGSGNDRLEGQAGNDLVLGGAGSDTLYGQSGRDILIGGLGSDNLYGGTDDDILIGGITDHDADPAALGQIMDEWNTARSDRRPDRPANVRGRLERSFLAHPGRHGAV